MKRLLAVLLFGAGCSSGGAGSPDLGFQPGTSADLASTSSPRDLGSSPTADLAMQPQPANDLQYCVQLTNQYRAMVSLPPLAESPTLEAYAAAGAQYDGTVHMAHAHFTNDANSGNLVAYAENEIPWWPNNQSVHDIITQGLAQMWAEGPPPQGQDNHYANITGPYTEYGCGVFVNGGEVTVTMDFR